mmetsp:Transcript_115530/g.337986  ORF Transcript_115530/g.337986 Transcript_115530/m.337986 type:complete len:364 (-) Transcript_115530:19-1110(-)
MHEVLYHLVHGGDIVDQTNRLPRGPGPSIRIAVLLRLPPTGASNEVEDVFDLELCGGLLDLGRLDQGRVSVEARGVSKLPIDDDGIQLRRLNGALLVRLWPSALLRNADARAQVHAVSAQGQHRRELRAGGNAAGCDEGHMELPGCRGQQHQVAHVVPAGVAGALEAVHREDVHAVLLRAQRVADRGALVDAQDASCLGLLDDTLELLPTTASGLHHRHFLLRDDARKTLVGRGPRSRQDREVYAEGLVAAEPLGLADPLPAVLYHLLVGPAARVVDREDAQAPRLRDRGRELRRAHACHASHHNRVLDAQQLRHLRLHRRGLLRARLPWLQRGVRLPLLLRSPELRHGAVGGDCWFRWRECS